MTGRKYKVAFYCPDRNIQIAGEFPGTRGMGGGKTAIVKMAESLCRFGNDVQCHAYCCEGTFHGVEYRDISRLETLSCDVLIAITGHEADISTLYSLATDAKMKILWLSGSGFIKGVDDAFFDYYYANSVFLKKKAVQEWHLPLEKVITTHQGFDPADFEGADGTVPRDENAFVFASHPSKGLDRVTEIAQRLRQDVMVDVRLDVYGGYRLWSDNDMRVPVSGFPWIRYRGMVSQPELCRSLFRYGFMLHLTDYEDTSSVLIHQAKRAGVIVIASDVGGNREVIENGRDGFVIADNYRSEECYVNVRKLITILIEDSTYAGYIRENASRHSFTWEKIAREWMRHWDETLRVSRRKKIVISGYYGFQNLGDETILSCMIDDMRRINAEVDIAVVSEDVFHTERVHGVRAIPRDEFGLQTKEVARCDLAVLGGGGLFQDHHAIKVRQFFEDHRYNVTSYANLPLMATIWEKPMIYCSQGVGPFFSKESTMFSRWAFRLAEAITVRDRYSLFLLTELLGIEASKVQLSYDAAMTAQIPDLQRAVRPCTIYDIPRDKRLVVVSVRPWINKALEDRVIREVERALCKLRDADSSYHYVFVPFQLAHSDNDGYLCSELASRLGSCATAFASYESYHEVLALYSIAELSIGMRYHSIIFSAVTGTPVIALSYDKKDEEFMRDLEMEELCIGIRSIDAEMLEARIRVVIENRSELQERLKTRLHCLLEERTGNRALFEQYMTMESEVLQK